MFCGANAHAVNQFIHQLDNGVTVAVHWVSLTDPPMDQSRVGFLVLTADRSTQYDCTAAWPNHKGLFKTGDLVFVTDGYVAWIDRTAGDGIAVRPEYAALQLHRPGVLAGWWTLDSATHDFRYRQTGPHDGLCTNDWPRNELMPGSASPNQELWMWDITAPPVEHALAVFAPGFSAPSECSHYADDLAASKHFLMEAHWATRKANNWSWVGPSQDSEGVHYKVTGMKAVGSWWEKIGGNNCTPQTPQCCNAPYSPPTQLIRHDFVDVVDGDDAEIANSIDTELEYVFTPAGLKVIWRFRPTHADIVLLNSYVLFWTAYARDEDQPTPTPPGERVCDVFANQEDWPDTGLSFHRVPTHVQSSMGLRTDFSWPYPSPTDPMQCVSSTGNPPCGPYPPPTIVHMQLAPRCPLVHQNRNVETSPDYAVTNGSWLRLGSSEILSQAERPRWQFTSLGVPGTGKGTKTDPYVTRWRRLAAQNEDGDGTVLFGATNQAYQSGDLVNGVPPADAARLAGGKWHSFSYLVSTNDGPLVPRRLQVDPGGNGILEPGETVEVRPSWLSAKSALTPTTTGSLSSFIGPAGATYTRIDSLASYPEIAEGATGTCGIGGYGCYKIKVSSPSVRPATHWGATVVETLGSGERMKWSVHVGGSFVDVPTTYWAYRFIETILHREITAGCGPGTFCPDNTLSRAEIAVLLLGAKHGPGWMPPPATGTVFADVPMGHWAARFIEALEAEQGQESPPCNGSRTCTSGCDIPGSYCPDRPVTRAEMAVMLLKAKHRWPSWNPDPDWPPQNPPPHFDDVPAAHWAYLFVEQLFYEGITGGCGVRLFCPESSLTRAQMAVFLTVTFDLDLN